MNDFPLISFIMPVYNDGKSVAKAIDSIFDQDWPNIEVIAVNDGSPDNSKEVLNELKKKYNNLTVLHFEKNKGACVARNEGAKIAKGKYFAWLPADAKIYPGMVRVWVETLERNPECDFLYGGYRFVDEEGNTIQNYLGAELEPYLLEVSNYIDGSFPIKAEAYWRVAKIMGQPDGLWDPNIKSLQDWDFWLSVVKEGNCKGLYFPDIFFETTLPHAGGLSDDSHRNWLARTNAIKRKHNIPDRKICVTSPGAPFFGKYLAKILDADYKEPWMLASKQHDYDLIYLLGFYIYPEQIAEAVQLAFVSPEAFNHRDQYEKLPLAPAVRIVHLIGTDLLQMSDLPKSYMQVYQVFLNNVMDHLFTEFKPTQKEAKELGLNSEVLALPPRKFFEVTPLPKDFTVAVYAPAVNQSLYSLDLMEKVAEKLPKVKFKFFGDPKKTGQKKGNIEYVGYVRDMASFINDCSCLMRITTHDGLPQSVIEFLSAGRRVIFNHDFNFVNTADKKLDVKALVKAIQEEMKQGLNEEAAEWIRKNFTKEKFKEKIYSLLTYDPKKYWNQKANNWLKSVGLVYNTQDWDKIEPYVKKLNPKSVVDVGCGEGQWSDNFDCEYIGLDISEKLIKEAQKRHPEREFINCSLEEAPNHINKKYDLAFCYTIFEHVPEQNMEQAVKALKKIAKKAILIEPKEIRTKYYCHYHNYKEWFKILKTEELGSRTMMLIDLSA